MSVIVPILTVSGTATYTPPVPQSGSSTASPEAITGVGYTAPVSSCTVPSIIARGDCGAASSLFYTSIIAASTGQEEPNGASTQNIALKTATGYANSANPVLVPAVTAVSTGVEGTVTNTNQVPSTLPSIVATGRADFGAVATSSAVVPAITGISETGIASSAVVPSIVASSRGTAGNTTVSNKAVPFIIASSTGDTQAVSSSTATRKAIVAASVAVMGGAGVSSQQLLRLIAAAQGHAGQVANSTVTLPLMVESSAGYVPAIGQSVSVLIPLVIAHSSAIQSAANNFSSIVMHTESQALSRYTNYPFNSFAKFNGVYLGASASGIFALSGATDDGVFIDAAARVGITDYNTSHLKKIDRAYVGYRADGDLVLRVFTEEVNVRDYLLKATGKAGLHGNHVRIGKGIAARYWQFEIRNKDGADFELDMIELKPTVLKRRVGGGNA